MPHRILPFIRKFAPQICRLAGCLLLIGTAMLPQAKGEPGSWAGTGSMIQGRNGHTATLLTNGKVLVAGGYSNNVSIASSELYDPATGLWTSTGSMNFARYAHTATLLTNGKVLVVGGLSNDSNLASSELYDPATGSWTSTGSLNLARSSHSATLLANGKVLVTGGSSNNSRLPPLASSELYDPATGLWSSTGSMNFARYGHAATLLASGKVLVAGENGNTSYMTSSELYDPATGLWTITGSLNFARSSHTTTLLANGKVLVAGGYFNITFIASSELYDPVTGLWTVTGSLNFPRALHTATLLANGKVLVAGGGAGASSELYDPATGSWTTTGSLNFPRSRHEATLLASGEVLVAGGNDSNVSQLAGSELYESDRVSGDYFYLVVNGAAIINGYRGAGGNVTIPATLDGFPVTGIGNNAFFGNTNIVTLTIPDGIASIGNQAFFGCTGLASIQLPEKFLTDIEYIGLSGPIAATTLIQGVANNLSRSNPFISDFTTAVLTKTGNYGLATKTDLDSAVDLLATKAELAAGVAPLASKTELSNSVAHLATKDELTTQSAALLSQLNALATNADFVAALAKNQTFLAALASQVSEGPNNYGIAIKQNQSLNFSPLPVKTYTPTVTKLTLAASSSAGLSPIVFTSSNTAVASIAGNILSIQQAGNSVITATQAGNANTNPVTATQTLTVNKITQTLSFRAIAAQTYVVNKTITLAAISSARLTPIVYSSANTAVATVVGNVVTLQGKGTTTISASQEGNMNYTSALVGQTLTVK
jgi:hypothetical protein